MYETASVPPDKAGELTFRVIESPETIEPDIAIVSVPRLLVPGVVVIDVLVAAYVGKVVMVISGANVPPPSVPCTEEIERFSRAVFELIAELIAVITVVGVSPVIGVYEIVTGTVRPGLLNCTDTA